MIRSSKRWFAPACALALAGAACGRPIAVQTAAPAADDAVAAAQAPREAPATPAAASAVSAAPAAQEASRDFVYVANQGEATISVVDRDAHVEVRRIDLRALGFSANAKPHHIVVEPDGSYWYVSLIGENRVLKFDRDNRLVAQVEFEVPGMLALHPTEDLLYVGRSMSAVNPPRSIGIVRRSTMELEDEVEVLYPRPHAIAVRPQGDVVYSASLAINQVAAVGVADGAVELTDLEGPTHTLVQFAVSPDGRTLVGTTELTAKLLVFDLADPGHPRPIRMIDVGARPWHPVFSPDGRTVWFGNKGANEVTVVDAGSWTVAAVVRGEGLAEPHGAAISPDGRWVFISNNNTGQPHGAHGGGTGATAGAAADGTLVVIDAAQKRIVKVIPVGANAAGIGTRSGS
ncbi:MAG TPA: YncE family protein [Longimicrobiales bacterium]